MVSKQSERSTVHYRKSALNYRDSEGQAYTFDKDRYKVIYQGEGGPLTGLDNLQCLNI